MARSRRGAWTQAKVEYLSLVSTILDDLRPYWPLTLRQVYYQLVAAGHIENRSTAYNKLSRILSQVLFSRAGLELRYSSTTLAISPLLRGGCAAGGPAADSCRGRPWSAVARA